MKLLQIALLCILISPAFSAFAADSDITWLGVVREDHTIIPFALFDGSSWTNPWPNRDLMVSGDIPDSPLTFDTIPKSWYGPFSIMPREWHVQEKYGRSTTVTVTRPVTVYSWCETFVGLLIGNTVVPAEPRGQVPLEGFAASSSIQTQPLTSMDKGSVEYDRMLSFIRQAFEKAEKEHNHPLSADARTKAEFSVECLVRGQPGPDDSTIAYFEVKRDYTGMDQLPPGSKFIRSYMAGWIVTDSTGTMSFIEKTVANKWPDDFTNIDMFTPLGAAVIDGKTLWIIRRNGDEGESYWVVYVTPTGIKRLFRFHGGGC